MQAFRLYGFIEEVEHLFASDRGETTAAKDVDPDPPSSIWIEADCIDADHFDSLVEDPPPLLDPAYRTDESLIERRELHDRLFADGRFLKTLYFTTIAGSASYDDWRRRLRPSTWHTFLVTLDGMKPIDMSRPNLISKRGRRHLVLMAEDPYSPRALIVQDCEIAPPTVRAQSDLSEVISLNHIDDLPLGTDRGGGGLTHGPLFPKPMPTPPMIQLEMAYDFEQRFRPSAAPVFDSACQGALDVYFDPEVGVWSFKHAGRRYLAKPFDSYWRSSTDGRPFLLFEVAGRVLVYEQHAISRKTVDRFAERSVHAGQPAESARQRQAVVAYQRSGS